MTNESATVILDPHRYFVGDSIDELIDEGLLERPIVIENLDDPYEVVRLIERQLADRQLDALRLVALRVGGGDISTDQLESEVIIGRELERRAKNAETRMRRGVIATLTEGTAVDAGEFHPDWDYNVMLPPVHSLGEQGFLSASIHENDAQTRWMVTLGLGLGCGLFTFLREGVFDRLATESIDGDDNHVRVCDLHLRLIDGGDVVGQVLTLAVDGSAGGWPAPPGYGTHSNQIELVRDLQLTASRDLGFGYNPHPLPGSNGSDGRSTKLTLGNCIRLLGEDYDPGAEDVAQETATNLGTALDELDDVGLRADGTIEDGDEQPSVGRQEARLEVLRRIPSLSVPNPGPHSHEWRVLRSVVLGAVDGGDFEGPLAGREPVDLGNRAVVTDRLLLIDPPDRRDPSGSASMNGTRSSAMVDPSDHLDTDGHQPIGGPDGPGTVSIPPAGGNLDGLATEIPQSPPDASNGSTSNGSTSNGSTSNGSTSNGSGEHEAELEPSFGTGLDERSGGRPRSFWTAIEDDLDQGAEEAWAAIASARDDWQRSRSAIEERLGALGGARRLVSFLLLGTVALLLLAVAIGVSIYLGDRSTSETIPLVAFASLAILFVLIGTVVSTCRYRALHAALAAESAFARQRMEAQQEAVRQFSRLVYLRRQADEWRDIMTALLHRPTGVKGTGSKAKPGVIEPAVNNFVVGKPVVPGSGWNRAADEMRGWLTQPGWLDRLYRKAYGIWRADYEKMIHFADPDLYNPDCDPSATEATGPSAEADGIDSSRRQFGRALALGTHSDQIADELRSAHEDACLAALVDDVVEQVESRHAGLDGRPIDSFLGGLVQKPSNGSLELFGCDPEDRGPLPPGIEILTGISAHPVSGQSLINDHPSDNVGSPDRRLVLASYRVSLSAPCGPESLAALTRPSTSTEEPMDESTEEAATPVNGEATADA